MRPSPGRGLFVEFWRELVGPPYFEYGVSLHPTAMLTHTRGEKSWGFSWPGRVQASGAAENVHEYRAELALSRNRNVLNHHANLKANALVCRGGSLGGWSKLIFFLLPLDHRYSKVKTVDKLSPLPRSSSKTRHPLYLVLLSFACQACPDISTPPHPENRKKYQTPLSFADSITATCKFSDSSHAGCWPLINTPTHVENTPGTQRDKNGS